MEISTDALSRLASNTEAQTQQLAEGYDQFLNLLTTQLQNQDPLEPLDSNEFTSQLVQFSQVEQQISTNQKIDELLKIQNGSLITDSLQYIGKDIYYRGNDVYKGADTGDLRVGYTMSAFPSEAKMRFVDEDGNTVRTIDLESDVSTSHAIWDGKDDEGFDVEDGVYNVIIDALDADGNPINSFTGVPAKVLGVEAVNGEVYLSLNGDRQVAAANALSVSLPESEVTPDA